MCHSVVRFDTKITTDHYIQKILELSCSKCKIFDRAVLIQLTFINEAFLGGEK